MGKSSLWLEGILIFTASALIASGYGLVARVSVFEGA
jgi:hypothetical protein